MTRHREKSKGAVEKKLWVPSSSLLIKKGGTKRIRHLKESSYEEQVRSSNVMMDDIDISSRDALCVYSVEDLEKTVIG